MKKSNKSRAKTGCLLFLLFLLLIVALGIHYVPVKEKVVEILFPTDYQDLIEKYCAEFEISPALVSAVIRCESGYDPSAVSPVGAIGLMQMTEDTFDWIQTKLDGPETFEDLYKPEVSLRYGIFFLSYLSDCFEGDREVLAAYHAGMNQVFIWLEDPDYSSDGVSLDSIPFPDTEAYVNRVMWSVKEYRKFYSLN